MQYAVGKWISPIVIVEVDPSEFDDPNREQLLGQLRAYFMVEVALVTPEWEAEHGIRACGLACPVDILVDPGLVWRELELPQEAELPF